MQAPPGFFVGVSWHSLITAARPGSERRSTSERFGAVCDWKVGACGSRDGMLALRVDTRGKKAGDPRVGVRVSLQLGPTAQGVYHACKFRQHSVASVLHDAPRCSLIFGSANSQRCALSRSCVPLRPRPSAANSPPHRRRGSPRRDGGSRSLFLGHSRLAQAYQKNGLEPLMESRRV